MRPTLYTYFRSSCAYRVRIALNLKQIDCDYQFINLKPGTDQQHSADYRALNPQGRLPFFVDEQVAISQSMAILEYLEERHPTPGLLPADPARRARVRQLSQLIACDIQPLNNLAVLNYLKTPLGLDAEHSQAWYAHWLHQGFRAFEAQLPTDPSPFCDGEHPSLADVVLVPQVWNARRFQVPLDDFPRLTAIADHCNTLPAFINAAPEVQVDSL